MQNERSQACRPLSISFEERLLCLVDHPCSQLQDVRNVRYTCMISECSLPSIVYDTFSIRGVRDQLSCGEALGIVIRWIRRGLAKEGKDHTLLALVALGQQANVVALDMNKVQRRLWQLSKLDSQLKEEDLRLDNVEVGGGKQHSGIFLIPFLRNISPEAPCRRKLRHSSAKSSSATPLHRRYARCCL